MIRTEKLTKKYKQTFAVKDVSMHVKKGEIYGFLGLNGAGKTTTLEMLLGLVRPTKGAAYLFNEQVQLKNYHLWEKVGYLLAAPYSYPDLTVEENLTLFARLRHIKCNKRMHNVIDRLQLQSYAHVKAQYLSFGNRVRLGIARSLLHDPDILILDEPVNGLDPAGIIEIRNLLQHLAFNEGVTILMSSHLLNEVAKIATTVGIIHNGKLIREMSKNKLTKELHKQLLLKTHEQNRAIKVLKKSYNNIEATKENGIMISDIHAICQPEKIAKKLIHKNISLTHLSVEEENLETYFLRMIRESS